MDIDKRNLIVYDMITGTKFVLRAAKTVTRDMWLTKSCLLIQQAKKDISNQLAARSRSTSEPTELARAASFSRKAMFRKEREGSKRKVKRPSSSTGVRENAEDMVRICSVNLSVIYLQCFIFFVFCWKFSVIYW